VVGGLLAGDLALVDEVLHERVVVGELAELPVAQQVGAGVADVGDVQARPSSSVAVSVVPMPR
jgi:hypothetical protein